MKSITLLCLTLAAMLLLTGNASASDHRWRLVHDDFGVTAYIQKIARTNIGSNYKSGQNWTES